MSGPSHPPCRLLAVAEGPCLCEFTAEILQPHGYEVDIARDGEAAWRKLQTRPYNLLLIENDLPGLDGVELLKKLRSAAMPLPVVMVIDFLPSWQSVEYPWLLKATKLFKPYSFEDLLGLLKKMVPTEMKYG